MVFVFSSPQESENHGAVLVRLILREIENYMVNVGLL
jgi:hypothetical protein